MIAPLSVIAIYPSLMWHIQTSGEPVLSAKDFVKGNLADHQNVTSLYNAFKDYLNQQTDLQVSETPLANLNGAKGYFQPSTNEIVIGGDEPDTALKLKTLYHEYAHSQLHGLKSAFKDRPRAYQETRAEAVAYVAMQNIGVDISDGLTKQLGLQEAQKEPEHDLKKLSAQDLNKSYQGLQLQVKQSTNPQQKSELKNQLTDVHQEISDRTQKQLQAFAKKNPEIKQPDSDIKV